MYGERSTIAICPGEDDCDRWAATSAKTHAIRERKACHGCPLFSTKRDKGRKDHESLSRLAANAIGYRYERMAGYPKTKDEMTNLEYQTLLMIEQMIEQEEVGMRKQVNSMLMAGFKLEMRG